MERSSKRGKIPQQDWPTIIKRYESGETLASIARTYDCSPPAISYIVSRSRARDAAGESAMDVAEQGLIKGHANEAPPSNASQGGAFGGIPEARAEGGAPQPIARLPGASQSIEPAITTVDPARALDQPKETLADDATPDRRSEGSHEAKPANADGSGALGSTSATHNGSPGRTLHLSSLSESTPRSDRPKQDAPNTNVSASNERFAVSTSAGNPRELGQPGRQAPASSPFAPVTINGPVRTAAEPHGMKESAFIDQALRERVDGDISAFLTAFDAALAHDTLESRSGLREATDRLLRAGARTRIELERLEARLPLPPRDNGANAPSAWRSR